MRFTRQGGFVHGADFSRYCIDALDWMWREGATQPGMMSIGLHLGIIGRPGRIQGLVDLLDAIQERRQDLWLARRDQIAHHWRALHDLAPFAAG